MRHDVLEHRYKVLTFWARGPRTREAPKLANANGLWALGIGFANVMLSGDGPLTARIAVEIANGIGTRCLRFSRYKAEATVRVSVSRCENGPCSAHVEPLESDVAEELSHGIAVRAALHVGFGQFSVSQWSLRSLQDHVSKSISRSVRGAGELIRTVDGRLSEGDLIGSIVLCRRDDFKCDQPRGKGVHRELSQQVGDTVAAEVQRTNDLMSRSQRFVNCEVAESDLIDGSLCDGGTEPGRDVRHLVYGFRPQ